MTTTLTPTRPEAVTGRPTFVALAGREMRRYVVNPVFLAGAVLTAFSAWPTHPNVTEIDTVIPYTIFLGGFGMMAAFWQTRSMQGSEPVVGTTPTTLPMRTAALCTVAIVPFLCGVLSLVAFWLYQPGSGDWVSGAFSSPARIAVLVGQTALPALGGPLLGVALGRWVRFPGAAFVAFLLLYGWISLVTILIYSHPDLIPNVVLRLFAPFAFLTPADNASDVTTWRGSPWLFIGWQLALCAITVLVALLRGADGQVRARIVRTFQIVSVVAVVTLVLAITGGYAHPVAT